MPKYGLAGFFSCPLNYYQYSKGGKEINTKLFKLDIPKMAKYIRSKTYSILMSLNYKVTKKDFRVISVVGKGAYGKVMLVKKLTGQDKGKYYAMKS